MLSNEIAPDRKVLPSIADENSKFPKQDATTDKCADTTEKKSDWFLNLLDEKNKTITDLKKQIENQKMQLAFYMKARMPVSVIEKMASTCTPSISDENMLVNLALSKFCKQFGIKTKLVLAYERMKNVDEKVSNLLKDQDFVLRKIINKLWEFIRHHPKNKKKSEFEDQFIDFIFDQKNLDLFNDLKTVTKRFLRKLDLFKICCQRLAAVEEERNIIVDQVFSMPVQERVNCNALLEVKMQNMKLENELRRIVERQQSHKNRLKELSAIENVLSKLQRELQQSYNKETEDYLNQMLEKLNEDANALLEMTKKKRQKCEAEMRNSESQQSLVLNRILSFIRLAVDNKDHNEKELNDGGIISKEDFKLYEFIKLEVDKLRQNLIVEFQEKSQKRVNEYELLRQKLNQLSLKTNNVKAVAKKYKKELKEIKFQNTSELIKLREERDIFKAQVEDLQAIREAYAQLVERQPNTVKMEREFLKQMDERDKRIYELEEENEILAAEVVTYRKKLDEQYSELTMLNRFIHLKTQNDKYLMTENVAPNCSSKEQSNLDSGLEHSSPSTIYSESGDLRRRPESIRQLLRNAVAERPFDRANYYDHHHLRNRLKYISNQHDSALLQESDRSINVVLPKTISALNVKKIFSKSFSSFSLSCPENKMRTISSDNIKNEVEFLESIKEKQLQENEFYNNFGNNEIQRLEDEKIDFDNDIILDESELLKDCSSETIPVAYHSKKSIYSSKNVSKSKDLIWLYCEKERELNK